MRCLVFGGGADLAQPLIKRWVELGHGVVAVIRRRKPIYNHPSLTVITERDGIAAVPFDALVVMPGSVHNYLLADMTTEQWDRSIEDNLTAPFRALRRFLPLVRDGGNAVVVGSIVGSTGGRGCANYAAAKAGLVGLVRAAANENAHRGICVNLLELGYMDAGMGRRLDPKVRDRVVQSIPLGRFGSEDDFVGAVEYLSSAKYMTGNVLTLAGGLR